MGFWDDDAVAVAPAPTNAADGADSFWGADAQTPADGQAAPAAPADSFWEADAVEPARPAVPAERTREARFATVAQAERDMGRALTVEERARIYQADAAGRGDVAEAVDFSRRRAGVDNAARDVETARAEEARRRMPYLEARGVLGGLTMGVSDFALGKAEEAMGGRVRAESTREQLGESLGRLAGGVATGLKLAPAVQGGLTKARLTGLSRLLATRMATTGIQAGLSSAAQVALGDQSAGGALKDVAQSLGASIVGVIPENYVPKGARNWVAQVVTDAMYDVVTDGLIRDRIKDQGFVNWLVTNELPSLVGSVVFATKDLTDKNFELQQRVVRYQIRNGIRTALEAPELRARGVPPEVIAAMRGAPDESARQQALNRWTVQGSRVEGGGSGAGGNGSGLMVDGRSGEAGTRPAAEPLTRAGLRALTDDPEVQGAVNGLLLELDRARSAATSGATGLTRREGEIQNNGWMNQGRAYPEGMDGETAPLVERWMRGEDLTDIQMQRVAEAVTYATRQLSNDVGYEIGKEQQVDAGALKVGDEFTVNGEKFRAVAMDEDGGLVLKDGVTRRVLPGETLTADKGTLRDADGKPVDSAARAAGEDDVIGENVNRDLDGEQRAPDLGGARRTDDGRWVVEDADGEWEIDNTTPEGRALLDELDRVTGIRSAVEETAAALPGARVRVVESEDQLPDNVQGRLRERRLEGGNLGVWDETTGEVWIVAGNHKDATEARRTVVHEVVGHKGLRAVLGDRLPGVLDGVFKARSTDRELGAIAKEYKLDLDTAEGRQEAAEELVARIAERRKEEPGPWKRLVANVRDWLRRAGLDLEWTDRDIEGLIDQAARRMGKKGAVRVDGGGAVRASRGIAVPAESDAAYLEAVSKGNTAEARRILDEVSGRGYREQTVRHDASGRVLSLKERFGAAGEGAVRLAVGATPGQKSMRDQAEAFIAAQKAAGKVPRRLNERLATRPGGIPELLTRPEAYRKPASMAERKAQYPNMDDGALMAGYRDEANNPWASLDGAELVNRLEERRRAAEASGDATAAAAARQASIAFIDEIGKDATRWGRMLRWLQEIRGATPAGMVSIAKRVWSNKGYMVPEQVEKRLTGMADRVLQATTARKTAEEAMQGTMTDAAIGAYDAAARAEHEALGVWLREVSALTPKSGAEIVKGFIQGNLLRGTTHQINVAANAVQVGLDFGADNLAVAAERLVKYAAAMSRGRLGDWARRGAVAGPRGLGGGLGVALRQGAREVITGLGPRDAREKWNEGGAGNRTFAPFRAGKQLFSGVIKPDSLDMLVREADGKVPAGDRFKKLAEWLGGAYPEANFRLLGLEDLAFRETRMNAVLRELGRGKGLKGNSLEVFVRVPDAAARQTAMDEALASVYQSKTAASQVTGYARKLLGQRWGRVAEWVDAVGVTPVMPYVNTVTNLGIVGLKLSHPVYAMATGLTYMGRARTFAAEARAAEARGDVDAARIARNRSQQAERQAWRNGIGYALVGGAMNLAAAAMYQAGLIEGSRSEDATVEELKRRLGRRPATWNRTAFARWVANGFDREAAKEQAGDVWATMLPLGFLGLNAVTVADRFKEYEANGIDPDTLGARDKVMQGIMTSLPFGARSMLELPMLQASMALLQSVDRGNYAGLVRSWLRGVSAVAVPGVVDQMSRAAQVAIPDVKHYQGWQQIKNYVAENNPWIDWETAFPAARDPLGRPVWRTPQGAPYWVHNVVAADKPTPMLAQDPVWREIGRVFEATTNVRAIPGYPDRTWTSKVETGPKAGQTVTVPLDGAEYEEFMGVVGAERMRLFRDTAQKIDYKQAPVEEQAKLLDKAWDLGLKSARLEWQAKKRQERAAVVARVEAQIQKLQDTAAPRTARPMLIPEGAN